MSTQCSLPFRKRNRVGNAVLLAGLCAMAFAGEAAADSYNFWLKSSPGHPFVVGATKCATGSFSYVKTGVTGEAGDSVSTLSMSISQDCINTGSPSQNLTMTESTSDPFKVVVRNIDLNGEPQGPNVDGLKGTMSSQLINEACLVSKGVPGNRYTRWDVVFSSSPGVNGRTYDINQVTSACVAGTPDFSSATPLLIVSNAPYYVFNEVHANPEPATLWLALGGLGVLAWSRRRKYR